ncbi:MULTISPECIES: TetR/AcrR family transcriptional regulator [Listeria]|uniref:TetR/AcrR family transcriptional regulator n=1 Tax=Listeria TaxID=1637 RepID=UPI000B58E6AC|nr:MULTISPECIES: TetR/AcrR family transcriptional regulator [Listeria]
MDRRIQKTKNAFYRAFLELLKTKNVQQITITELVQEADVNRSTFYKHYGEKEDLLHELTESVLNDLRTAYDDPYKQNKAFSTRNLQPHMIKIFDHVYRNQLFYSHVISSKIGPGFQNRVCHVIQDLVLRDATKSNLANINPQVLTSYQAHAIFGIIVYWTENHFQESADYMAQQLFLILKAQHQLDTAK